MRKSCSGGAHWREHLGQEAFLLPASYSISKKGRGIAPETPRCLHPYCSTVAKLKLKVQLHSLLLGFPIILGQKTLFF